MPPLCTREQVIERLGGDEAAAQLLDPHRTGSLDTAVLDGAIADATGDVEAAYGARFAALAASAVVPAKVVRIATQLAVYYCWQRGGRNLAMPEGVKQMYGNARGDLERIEASESGPGGTPTSRFPREIDNSFGGRRAVWSTWRRAGPNGAR